MKDKLTIIAIFSLLISCQQQDTNFVLLSPKKTNIHFSNHITESDSINILVNEYIYNGGGVGIGDFNADGLSDVYFTGNMVDNKLYLNEGNFQFKDITEAAGVGTKGKWSSGVAVVDINADGLDDLYVCATNRPNAAQRRNSFFINQGLDDLGIPIFKEIATEYGLADTSHTTNAAFFDYDRDGDLDVFLAVNEMDKNNLPNVYRDKITDGTSSKTDKLFRNDFDERLGHAVFTDVSKEAGILIEGFSLGINITDINQDGWLDIYVTNDFVTNDLLYLNNQDGTFTNQASELFQHTSHSAMGNDVVDINNDGLSDFIALDMLPEDNFRRKTMLMGNNYTSYINNDRFGYDYQYVRNTLQLNRGQLNSDSLPEFSDIAMLSGISSTDWSWAPLVADFDHDSFRDIIITNGFPRDITDRDFVDYYEEVNRLASRQLLLQSIPMVKIKNYAYRNKGDLTFENVSNAWGINLPSFSNGAAYADLDNDGDLDYIVNNINDSAFVFQNKIIEKELPNSNYLRVNLIGTAKNPKGLGAKIKIFLADNKQLYWEQSPYRGYLSSVESMAHFGLGAYDNVTVQVIWTDGKQQYLEQVAANQVLTIDYKNASSNSRKTEETTPIFQEVSKELNLNFIPPEIDFVDFNTQPLMLHKLSQYGPSMAVSDVNGDGLEDVYVSGSREKSGQFFLQQMNGQFLQTNLFDDTYSTIGEEQGVLFFDADLDGDEDLYLSMGGFEKMAQDGDYQDQLFLNNNGQFIKSENALPDFRINSSCVKAADYDQDGDLDLFIGSRVQPLSYPKSESSYLLQNDGSGKFKLLELPILRDLGMVCDALWTDVDQDGWIDLMIAAEWMPLTILKNEAGQLQPIKNNGLGEKTGWWNSLSGGDFDKDGDIDYIAGNLGMNHLFQGNDTIKAALYAADFDNNGGYDVIPVAYFPDREGNLQEYPYFGRLDFQKQLIAVRKYFARHKDFAVATVPEILPLISDAKSLYLKANYFKSSYIENLGDGTFIIHSLPIEAQFSTVYATHIQDFDSDGNLDVLLIGNDYGMEVGMGKQDASKGLLLKGNGEGIFRTSPLPESNFLVKKDAKAIVSLFDKKGSTLIIASQNKAPLRAFRVNNPKEIIPLSPLDAKVEIKLKNGNSIIKERYYGSSFFSASSRKISVSPSEVLAVIIYSYDGRKREIELKGN